MAELTLNHNHFLAAENVILTLTDEVEKSCYLTTRKKAPHAPQLQLLEEWCLNNDLKKFHRKLRVDPDVFTKLVERVELHPVFSNNSNNQQLPVAVQLAIFLNGVGHYGNSATTEDIAEWAGVSLGTVYNCYRCVMIALLQQHDNVIHFDPMELEDQEERDRAKRWVESRSCPEWRGGFLCVDGSPINLFQKPGWHGEGFFDRKSRYSLSAQVCAMLRITHDALTICKGYYPSPQPSNCRLCDRCPRESSRLKRILTHLHLLSPRDVPRS
ncbi:hypothetical protein PISMIDRAFT_106775 [Pisolithus microcarpus 441]|uniref:Unplaced genomic scaffold scaffold_92, whole genome shotgun sequence n=1 Tax=Pisolithus microcarpus 441 TaxID=765257 RepID=A0A0C9YT63_9AGAM|nr:hypothetical protein PISMIDRAFT_106775 [Pisolithus microcarpus 441]